MLRAAAWLPGVLYAITAVWGVVSLAGLPPLADPTLAERLSGPLVAVASLSVLLYLVAAVRFYLLYRRRRSVMLLSLITASALLAESMVAVMLADSWQLTWWLWHVLMVLAFGYVGYSAYVTYQREGATTGLFDGIGTDADPAGGARRVRRGAGGAGLRGAAAGGGGALRRRDGR